MGGITKSLKFRVFQALLEIVAGVAAVTAILFLFVFVLYTFRVINLSNVIEKVDAKIVKNTDINIVENYLKKIKADYIIYNNERKIISGYMADKDKEYSLKVLNNNKNLTTAIEEYVLYKRADGYSVIIRSSFIPEFIEHSLRARYNLNSLINIAFIILCVLVILYVIFRLVKQCLSELKELSYVIKCYSAMEKYIPKIKPQITEIDMSIQLARNMGEKMYSLLEKERTQKKDLNFQIAALSHDIKTPLTIIKGNVGLLEYGVLDEEQRECIECINSGIKTTEEYLDRMLLYTKWLYGPDSKKRIVSLEELAERILDEIKGYGNSRINFLYIPQKFEDILINCSVFNVKRAVVNIISNAYDYALNYIKFTIVIDEKYIFFKIFNDGNNISEDSKENIGKLFYTNDKGRNSKIHYGLGIFFAKEIALSHGGDLYWENLDGGVEFVFYIDRD